jgi:membrane-bound ClpP family serine protease
MEPLVPGGDRTRFRCFSAFVVGKGKKRWREKRWNVLCPIDASGGKVFVEGEYWSAASDTFVKKGEPVQTIAVEALTTKVKPET